MKHYELLYIVPAKFAGAEMETIQDKVKKIIDQEGGQIDYEENLGKKKFAYPIKHNLQGFYVINEFDLEPDKLQAINNKIKLTSEVLRHLIVVKEKLDTQEREKLKTQPEKRDKSDKGSAMADQFNIEKQLDDETKKPEPASNKDKKQTETVISPTPEKTVVKNQGEEKKEDKTEKAIEQKEPAKKGDTAKLEDLDKKLDEIIDSDLF